MTDTCTHQHIHGPPSPIPSALLQGGWVSQQRQGESGRHEAAPAALPSSGLRASPGDSAHLCVLLGDEVHKAKAPVSAGPCHLLWQAHCLQLPEGARDKRQTSKTGPRALRDARVLDPVGYQRLLVAGTPTTPACSCGFPVPHSQPSSAGVAFFSLLATTGGREGTIGLEVLMGNFWCLSCHLGDTWTLVLSPMR